MATSFPFLAVARKHGISYDQVWSVPENKLDPSVPWQRDMIAALVVERQRRADCIQSGEERDR